MVEQPSSAAQSDVFAADAEIGRDLDAVDWARTPLGPKAGWPQSVRSHAESFTRFEASQHLLTGHHVTIDGDAATVRANLVAIHLWKDQPADANMSDRSFTAGGVITADLLRTADGWRIAETRHRVLWRTGHFGNMLQTR